MRQLVLARRAVVGVTWILGVFVAHDAQAQSETSSDSESETSSASDGVPHDVTATPPDGRGSPNPTLLKVGLALGVGGYAPNLLLGAPSGVGLVGRVFALIFTLGIPCWLPGVDPDPDATPEEQKRSLRAQTPDYLCRGDHGAIQLLVPMAGPFLFATAHPRDSILNPAGRELSVPVRAAFYTSGASQVAGVTLLIAAVLNRKAEPAHDASPAAVTPHFQVQPWVGGGAVGISAGITHW